jgi:uncharacterized HAD superfamily protein
MIALDIDGVVCDFNKDIFLPVARRVLNRQIDEVPVNDYHFRKLYGITKEEEQRVWDSEWLLYYMERATPIVRAITLLNTLERAGEDHCFITARGTHQEDPQWSAFRHVTGKWMRETVGSFMFVYYVKPENKVHTAVEIGVTQMWEDHPDTAIALADAGIEVFMPAFGYNCGVQHENVHRMEGWHE